MNKSLLYNLDDAVAILTINDEPYNRMSLDFMDELEKVVKEISSNKDIEQVCVVGDSLPQPIALIVLSATGESKNSHDLITSLKETLDTVNSKLNSHEKLNNFIVVCGETDHKYGYAQLFFKYVT